MNNYTNKKKYNILQIIGLIQNALGSFHIPAKPISQTVEEEHGDEVRDLTRRFFHHLLR